MRAHGIALIKDPVSRPKNGRVDGAIVVPDGVAKIAIGEVNFGGRRTVFENVTVAVHDNVATVQLKTPTSQTPFGLIGPHAVLRMTWFDAHGKVIRHTTAALGSPSQASPQ